MPNWKRREQAKYGYDDETMEKMEMNISSIPLEDLPEEETDFTPLPKEYSLPSNLYEKHTSRGHRKAVREADLEYKPPSYERQGYLGRREVKQRDITNLFDLGNNIFDIGTSLGSKGLHTQRAACSLCGDFVKQQEYGMDFVMGTSLCQKCERSGVSFFPF